MKKEIISSTVVKTTIATHIRLSNQFRYPQFTNNDGFNKTSHQALIGMFAFFLCKVNKIIDKKPVDETKIPKLFLLHFFKKGIIFDQSEERYFKKIFLLNSVIEEKIQQKISEEIENTTSADFLQFISVDPNCFESLIFKASKRLATYAELLTFKNEEQNVYLQAISEARLALEPFTNIHGVKELFTQGHSFNKVFSLFMELATLRNTMRWAQCPVLVKISVLSHSYFVAQQNYLTSLEVSGNESLATRAFFSGIFHDLVEKYTGDMPRPLKDSIHLLRESTEEVERQEMEDHIYTSFPSEIVPAIKNIMLEEVSPQEKTFFKLGDNLAAIFECWQQLDAGSSHVYFSQVVTEGILGKWTPATRAIVYELIQKVPLTKDHYIGAFLFCFSSCERCICMAVRKTKIKDIHLLEKIIHLEFSKNKYMEELENITKEIFLQKFSNPWNDLDPNIIRSRILLLAQKVKASLLETQIDQCYHADIDSFWQEKYYT